MVLTVAIAAMAFVLSFDALRVLAVACGVQESLSWMFPLIIDAPVLAFTWATWVFKTRGMGQAYPWAMLIVFSMVSLVGNALHAHPVETNGLLLPDWAAALLMTMPPVALLATSHMMVRAASRGYDLSGIVADGTTDEPTRTVDAPVSTVAPTAADNTVDEPARTVDDDTPAQAVVQMEAATTTVMVTPMVADSMADEPSRTVEAPTATVTPTMVDNTPAQAVNQMAAPMPAIMPTVADSMADEPSRTVEATTVTPTVADSTTGKPPATDVKTHHTEPASGSDLLGEQWSRAFSNSTRLTDLLDTNA